MTESRLPGWMTGPRYQRAAGPPSATLRMSRMAKRPTTRTSAPKSLGRADCMSVPQITYRCAGRPGAHRSRSPRMACFSGDVPGAGTVTAVSAMVARDAKRRACSGVEAAREQERHEPDEDQREHSRADDIARSKSHPSISSPQRTGRAAASKLYRAAGWAATWTATASGVPGRGSAGSSGCEQGPVTPGDEALLVARPAHQASRQVGIRSCETEAAGITPRPQARDEVGIQLDDRASAASTSGRHTSMSSAARTASATGRRTLMAVGAYCRIVAFRRTKCAGCCIEASGDPHLGSIEHGF